MKYLIAGLGNIGDDYTLTRHNIGFMAIDHILSHHDTTTEVVQFAHKAEIQYKGRCLHLIKPTCYMNQSGKAVNYWLTKLNIPKSRLLIIVDDIAIALGRLRLRAAGSHGGHNGLADIEASIGRQEYARLRMGIGNNFPKGDQARYVLSPFYPEEQKLLPQIMDSAEQIAYSFCFAGIQHTMNAFN